MKSEFNNLFDRPILLITYLCTILSFFISLMAFFTEMSVFYLLVILIFLLLCSIFIQLWNIKKNQNKLRLINDLTTNGFSNISLITYIAETANKVHSNPISLVSLIMDCEIIDSQDNPNLCDLKISWTLVGENKKNYSIPNINSIITRDYSDKIENISFDLFDNKLQKKYNPFVKYNSNSALVSLEIPFSNGCLLPKEEFDITLNSYWRNGFNWNELQQLQIDPNNFSNELSKIVIKIHTKNKIALNKRVILQSINRKMFFINVIADLRFNSNVNNEYTIEYKINPEHNFIYALDII